MTCEKVSCQWANGVNIDKPLSFVVSFNMFNLCHLCMAEDFYPTFQICRVRNFAGQLGPPLVSLPSLWFVIMLYTPKFMESIQTKTLVLHTWRESICCIWNGGLGFHTHSSRLTTSTTESISQAKCCQINEQTLKEIAVFPSKMVIVYPSIHAKSFAHIRG